MIADATRRLKSEYGGAGIQFATHWKRNDSVTWESVVDEDPYFKDVKVIDTVDDFISIILRDRYLRAIDVAWYILSVRSCTLQRLETLTYLSYADYMRKTGKRLFEDDEISFTVDGLVIRSISDVFAADGSETERILRSRYGHAMVSSRIDFAQDGTEKHWSIDDTLSRCRGVRTTKLTDLAHRDFESCDGIRGPTLFLAAPESVQ